MNALTQQPSQQESQLLQSLQLFKVANLPEVLVANAIYLVASKEDVSGVEVHIADKHGVSTRATLSKGTVQELINLASIKTLEKAQLAAQEADENILEKSKEYTNQQVEQAQKDAIATAEAYTNTVKLEAIQISNAYANQSAADVKKEASAYTDQAKTDAKVYTDQAKTDARAYADETAHRAGVEAKAYTNSVVSRNTDSVKRFAQDADSKILEQAREYIEEKNTEIKRYVDDSDAQILIQAKGEISAAKSELNNVLAQSSIETLNSANSYTDDALKSAVQGINQRTDTEIKRAIGNAPNELLIVETYVDLLKLILTDDRRTKSKFVFVKDATGDNTVKQGSASYIYNADVIQKINLQKLIAIIDKIIKNPSQNIRASLKEFFIDEIFYKVAEHESMDVVLSWDSIQNKPNSTVQNIDATVENFRTLRLDILQNFSDEGNQLYYKGQPIDQKGGMAYSGDLSW